MNRIELKLFVTLAAHLPDNPDAFEISEGTTVQALMQDLNIPDNSVKLIFVNGKKQAREYQLRDGDRLGLFPPVGGG